MLIKCFGCFSVRYLTVHGILLINVTVRGSHSTQMELQLIWDPPRLPCFMLQTAADLIVLIGWYWWLCGKLWYLRYMWSAIGSCYITWHSFTHIAYNMMTKAGHQNLISQKTPHISPSRAKYGMSIVSILVDIDHVIKDCTVQSWLLSTWYWAWCCTWCLQHIWRGLPPYWQGLSMGHMGAGRLNTSQYSSRDQRRKWCRKQHQPGCDLNDY